MCKENNVFWVKISTLCHIIQERSNIFCKNLTLNHTNELISIKKSGFQAFSKFSMYLWPFIYQTQKEWDVRFVSNSNFWKHNKCIVYKPLPISRKQWYTTETAWSLECCSLWSQYGILYHEHSCWWLKDEYCILWMRVPGVNTNIIK